MSRRVILADASSVLADRNWFSGTLLIERNRCAKPARRSRRSRLIVSTNSSWLSHLRNIMDASCRLRLRRKASVHRSCEVRCGIAHTCRNRPFPDLSVRLSNSLMFSSSPSRLTAINCERCGFHHIHSVPFTLKTLAALPKKGSEK